MRALCKPVVNSMISVTPREWVAAFYLILGIVVVAIFGVQPLTALVILLIVLLTMLANRACSIPQYTYWQGLRLVATINLTGETLIGQVFVLPALAIASTYS
jgi:hypothetical protein